VAREKAKIVIMEVIQSDPEIMSGEPCFAGTRVPVRNLFDCLEANYSVEEFLADFPSVTREQVIAVLELARRQLVPAA
jgi:uncharacterized protein (DUF433 family)